MDINTSELEYLKILAVITTRLSSDSKYNPITVKRVIDEFIEMFIEDPERVLCAMGYSQIEEQDSEGFSHERWVMNPNESSTFQTSIEVERGF